jgi:hypothetical protein
MLRLGDTLTTAIASVNPDAAALPRLRYYFRVGDTEAFERLFASLWHDHPTAFWLIVVGVLGLIAIAEFERRRGQRALARRAAEEPDRLRAARRAIAGRGGGGAW